MSGKKIFTWVLLLFGEALIIASFIIFRGNIQDNILTLNIIVSSVIYCSFFVDILVPWIKTSDKTQRRVGSFGVRWFITWVYFILAIALMVCANIIWSFSFPYQVIAHCILIFVFLMGILGAIHSSDKVHDVYNQQIKNLSGLIEMKKAMRILRDKMYSMSDLPEDLVKRITSMEENLRFISPADTQEAFNLESSFIETTNSIGFAISNFSMNKEQIEHDLKKLERTYQNRKTIYSN